MAKSSRPISAARRAVLSDPVGTVASTTSIPIARAAIGRSRRGKLWARAAAPSARSSAHIGVEGTLGVARLALDQEVGPTVGSGASGAEGLASGGAKRSPTAIGPVAETSRPYDMPSNKRNTNT